MGTTEAPPCPPMPSPASELDLGPFEEVCIREVISRMSVVIGGSLNQAIYDAVHGRVFGPDETMNTAGRKAELLMRADAATQAIDALLSTFDEAFPAPGAPDEGF